MLRPLSVLAVAALACGCASTPVEPAPAPSTEARFEAPAGTSRITPARPSIAAATTAHAPGGAARIVYFGYDSYTVRPEFEVTLQTHARFLREHPNSRVVVEGHTDERGGREYNLALGQRRSEAVRRALSLFGAGSQQVESVSFGEEKPVRPGGGEPAWGENRRAEIRYR